MAETMDTATAPEAAKAAGNKRAKAEKQRRRRRSDTTIGRHLRLALDTSKLDQNFVYRWVNDTPGRVQMLTQQDDWDVVKAADIGDHESQGQGSNAERVVSQTDGMRAVLLRKPREYYEEDKAKEMAAIDEMEDSMRRGSAKDATGQPTQPVENAYTPAGGGIAIHKG